MTMALTKRENGSLTKSQPQSDVEARIEVVERSWAGALVDVYESDDDWLVVAEVPGVPREGINVEYKNQELRIEGRRTVPDYQSWSTDFRRVVRIGSDIDVDGITAELKDGLLHIRLPKLESAKPRRIEVRRV